MIISRDSNFLFFSSLILFYFMSEGPVIKLYDFDENKNVLALFPL